MKALRIVVAATAAVTFGHVAGAASPQVWQGDAFITGFTSSAAQTACGTNASVGDYYRVVYRPIIAGSPDNGTSKDEGLTFFGSRNGMHYYTAAGVSFANPGKAFTLYLDSHAGSDGQTTGSPAAAYNLKIMPNSIKLTTLTVTISGFVDNFTGVSGCDVTFSAALTRRVD